MSAASGAASRGVSIVCVFNNLAVREECLDASIAAYSGDVEVEFLPVDNREHAFTTAGAALNHGARAARHDLVVFVHQDVYLQSIDRLAELGPYLTGGDWAVLGASGVTSDGEVVGLLRDRTDLIGTAAPEPRDVDSLDEVLFMTSREQMIREPLTEDPALAWHAYAVEYCARMRTQGRRVGAVDCAITHNSLTINLAKLDVAHRYVGDSYPVLQPIHTTCGTIAPKRRIRDLPLVRDHRWRLRWLRYSLLARRVRRTLGLPVVLADIRHDVDFIAFDDQAPLHVVNFDRIGSFARVASAPLPLTRLDKPVVFVTVGERDGLIGAIADQPPTTNVLVTDLTLDDVQAVVGALADRSWTLGIQEGSVWLLGGEITRRLPEQWSAPRAVPLGGRA